MARPERARHEAPVPQPTPERKRRAKHRRWAGVVAIVAGVYAFALAVWTPGLAGGEAATVAHVHVVLVLGLNSPTRGRGRGRRCG